MLRLDLGMNVIGFDRQDQRRAGMGTALRAWSRRAVLTISCRSDMVTLHVPLMDATRGLPDHERRDRAHAERCRDPELCA